MDVYQTIISKRDLRQYTGDSVSEDVMHRVLQAGRMAGSAKNLEPNRLVVVTNAALKTALTAAGDFTSWIDTAPVVIGIAAEADSLRLFDTGRTAQNIMLAAHAEGLGTCPVTFQHQDVAREAIGFPADWVMPIAITLGWPVADAPKSPLARPRVALDELVKHDRW